jgi:hypothetical protein
MVMMTAAYEYSVMTGLQFFVAISEHTNRPAAVQSFTEQFKLNHYQLLNFDR